MNNMCCKRLLLIPLISLVVLVAAYADPVQQQAQKQAAGEAHELVQQLQSTVPDATTSDPAMLVPGYSEEVPQTEFYGLGDQLTTKARDMLPDNEAAGSVNESASSRQNIVLDREHDPLLQRSQDIMDGAEDIVGMGESTQSECITVPPNNTTITSIERCTSWNASQQNCTQNCYCPNLMPVIQGMQSGNNIGHSYNFPQLVLFSGTSENTWDRAWGSNNSKCRNHDAEFSFEINNINAIKDFILQDISWLGHIRLELNGQQVYIAPHAGNQLSSIRVETRVPRQVRTIQCGQRSYNSRCDAPGSHSFRCCSYVYSTVYSSRYDDYIDYGLRRYACSSNKPQQHHEQPGLDLKPWLKDGKNTLRIRNVSNDVTGVRINIKAISKCSCEQDSSLTDGACNELQQQTSMGQCQLQDYSCLDGTQLCSQQSRNYICLGNELREEPYCSELRQRGCVWADSTCVDTENGNCIEYEQQYQCGINAMDTPQMEDCGERITCIGGDCTDTGYAPSTDFAKTASHLSAIQELALDFDEDSLSVFSGGDYRCKKSILGFSNCCRDSGWGVSLGLSRCSNNERELGEKRQMGQCHYVGSYKRGSLFNKKRYQSYCCFSSKLGRLIQQQGRQQLNLHWGAATAPMCRGLSTEELGRLDFESMDFGEAFADMLQQAADSDIPAAGSIGERLRQRIREMQ